MTRALPGLAVALGAVGIGWLVHLALPAVPLLTVCVALGVLVAQLAPTVRLLDGALQPGVALAAKRAMRAGIVLLGLQLVLGDVLRLGLLRVLAVVGVVALAFGGTYLIARAARLPGREPLLLATGFAICGASAIGAMAAVTRSDAREQSRPVALVTLCGTLAIVVLPLVGTATGMAPVAFGRWAGAGVHDVGQVVATAQQFGATALAAAIVVKLLRVLLLAPVVAIAGVVLRARGEQEGERRPPIVPLFVIGFVVAVLLRSLLPLPAALLEAAQILQTVLLGMALFGLGAGIRFRDLAGTGVRTAVVGLSAWALIAVAALAVVAACAAVRRPERPARPAPPRPPGRGRSRRGPRGSVRRPAAGAR
ncbi:YeiH family protein [Amnibacterium endophyticum]|uniref:YeiH family protein n=1 Tax=Amnibacterium endophyticum TaxID=2109337 RepID=A0ABW4LCF6_9MICO